MSASRGSAAGPPKSTCSSAEGRADIWPAGDLAVQIEVGRILGLDARPTEALVRTLAEPWRPHRGAAAIFTWHHYGAGADMKVI